MTSYPKIRSLWSKYLIAIEGHLPTTQYCNRERCYRVKHIWMEETCTSKLICAIANDDDGGSCIRIHGSHKAEFQPQVKRAKLTRPTLPVQCTKYSPIYKCFLASCTNPSLMSAPSTRSTSFPEPSKTITVGRPPTRN